MPSHVTKKRKTSATTDVKKKNVSVEKKDKSASPSASEASDSESSTGGIDINEASGSEASIDNGDEFPLSSENDSDSDSDNLSDILSTQHPLKKRKRNDPAVFSTTMSKILSSHLTTTARKDPVLVRAKHSAAEIDESKIEAKARRVLREEKRKEMEKGRVRDVVPRDDDEAARRALELEKRLRKTAQRGVVKLFNAVRAAQIKAEEGSRVVKKEGVVGIGKRGEKVTEMSKQGFLSLIQQSGGK
ncbi:Rrp15p-domain-containing protein [Choiromyces venosus 120613-1]|uniref:Rrp15p-domain-containing protein n=1 Tax=Choiromyces venosus 120613-1 TaxID=1336337 RepID=A0A3N4K2K3_9PEZI|nr:Rrp15p-domain-containing protein [Choiromyces venosus 120613-1]